MSSKRKQRRKSCDGKVRHSTSAGAWIATREMRGRGELVRPYHCKFCGGYHIGHFNPARARVRAKK